MASTRGKWRTRLKSQLVLVTSSEQFPVKDIAFNRLCDSSGVLISDMGGKLTRWIEHVNQLLDHSLDRLINMVLHFAFYNITCCSPLLEEITNMICCSKYGKGPDEGGIVAEIYKMCIPMVTEPLHTLLRLIWEAEKYPFD